MQHVVKCVECNFQAELSGFPYHCPQCDGILLPHFTGAEWPDLKKRAQGLERLRPLLPLHEKSELVTLGEGNTPLIPAEHLTRSTGIDQIWLKNETINPTGSFKDRALAVMVTRAREEGYSHLVASSSGNAGASTAAYGARAGMRVTILVPASTPDAKLAQIALPGGEVFRVKGTTSETYELAKQLAQEGYAANLTTTFLSPLSTAGFKTMGYELAEELEYRPPDWIIVPVSDGPILVAIALAFFELQQRGMIKSVPRMVAAQAAACAPIVAAFEQGADQVEPWAGTPHTLATSIADPLRGYAADGTLTVEMVRRTGGMAVSVTEVEIGRAVRQLAAQEGVFAEPAGAVPLAALTRLSQTGAIQPDESVVCVITGHGLKDPLSTMDALAASVVEPDLATIVHLLKTNRHAGIQNEATV